MVSTLRESKSFEIIEATHDQWAHGFDLFSERTDKEWSLVDCISILACEQRGLRQVLTSDRHFAQAGFEILL